MSVFQKSMQDEQQFAQFVQRIDQTVEKLSPYADYTNLSLLRDLRKRFTDKTDDFFREDRKLNIGVIGQVKAGKSSFLNTLLFDGKKVLPSAATPKTATLTKIEYSEDNKLVVEYYSKEEWGILEDNARVDSNENEFEAAREIMKMCREKGLVPSTYIEKQSEAFAFASADELMARLDDYVGENGTYTALVKNVTIFINNPELKDISIVDTPGLNDAIASRTDRTRQFIERCDVVFFLSRASLFLDKNDIRLLTSQLPQKGVKRMVMICSRFDDGLQDTLYDVDSMEEAIQETRRALTQRAVSVIKGQSADSEFAQMLEPCKQPIFVSSMCWNMSRKNPSSFDRQELHIFGNLNEYDDVDAQMLKRIGNMDPVHKIYEQVVADKDETLREKARSFVPDGEAECKDILSKMRQTAERHLEILKSGDRKQLAEQKKALAEQINGVKGGVETVFGEVLTNMEQAKLTTMQKLRTASVNAAKLSDQQGTETIDDSYYVKDSKWWNPFSWGRKRLVHSTREQSYLYLDASDALENIRIFVNEACSDIERALFDSIDVIGTKRKLLNVVIENFDTGSELFDPGFFRLIAEQTLNQVAFPVIKMDVSKEQAAISSRFSGEIRDSKDRAELRTLLANTIDGMLATIEHRFMSELSAFRMKIAGLKTGFTDQLLKNLEEDYNQLMGQFEDKEKEISNYQVLLTLFRMV